MQPARSKGGGRRQSGGGERWEVKGRGRCEEPELPLRLQSWGTAGFRPSSRVRLRPGGSRRCRVTPPRRPSAGGSIYTGGSHRGESRPSARPLCLHPALYHSTWSDVPRTVLGVLRQLRGGFCAVGRRFCDGKDMSGLRDKRRTPVAL